MDKVLKETSTERSSSISSEEKALETISSLEDVTKPVKKYLIISVLLGAVASIFLVLQMGIIAHLVTDLAFNQKTIFEEEKLLLLLLFAVGVRSLLQSQADTFGDKAAIKAISNLRMEVMAHLFCAGPVALDLEATGKTATALSSGIEALGPYIARYIPRLSAMVILPVILLAVVFSLDKISFAVLMITGPLIPVFMALVGYAAQAVMDRQWNELLRLSGSFLDYLQGMTTLRLFGRAHHGAKWVAKMAEGHRKETFKVMRIAFLSSGVLEFFASISIAIVAVVLGGRLLAGTFVFQDAFFILLLAPEYFLPLRIFSNSYHARQNAQSAFEPLLNLLSLPPLAEEARKQSSKSPEPSVDQVSAEQLESLVFKGVCAGYRDGENVIDDFSAVFLKNKLTVISGPSGAGKTTIFRLLLGMIPMRKGEIFLKLANGKYSARSHLKTGWVPQSPYFFAGTITENLRLSAPNATLEEMRKAAEEAGALSFIENFEGGFAFKLGDRGAPLSGGQVRRLALARALLSGATLLALDEPTADLDQENAELLAKAIERSAEGRIVVVISHREDVGDLAVQNLYLDHGKIVSKESLGAHQS
ncbi:thiol reductant ABC exporter subunit CydD [Acetobacteraceae bacterium]|nr:thiol reductant ABC exporter subunit CydD [Acetobacteraceae bacterium]